MEDQESRCQMAGRTTNDPKETTIKLRINDDMRNHIEKKSKSKSITMSEYVRNLIRKDMSTFQR